MSKKTSPCPDDTKANLLVILTCNTLERPLLLKFLDCLVFYPSLYVIKIETSLNGSTENFLESSVSNSQLERRQILPCFARGKKKSEIKQSCPSDRLFNSHYGIMGFLEKIITQCWAIQQPYHSDPANRILIAQWFEFSFP